jgi:hypothetical protein
MSPNRVVAVLTPLVFAPLAGTAAAWLAEHFPGVEIQQSSLQEIFIAGALIALAPAAQWLHGWQKHEAQQHELVLASAMSGGETFDEEAAFDDEPVLDDELDELDELDGLAEPDDLDDELAAIGD